MTEAQIEKKLVAFCREHGLLTYKFASPSHRGVPDRIIMGGGKVMFLELKAPGNEPTKLQFRTAEHMRDHGAYWTWSDNYRDTVEKVSAYFRIGETVDGI